MFQLLLIRAGATEYDEQGRIQGTLDIPLSEDGRRKANAVIAALRGEPIDAVYASPCESALHTAEALAEPRDLKAKQLDDLRNLDHGLWQGMLVHDVKAKQPKVYRQWVEQPETVCPPEGETVAAGKARVAGLLTRLIKRHKKGEQVALVVPEPLASVVTHVLRHDTLANLWQHAHANGNGNGETSPEGPPLWERIVVAEQLAGAP